MSNVAPTQSRYPWRAVARTIFAVIPAFAVLWPSIVAASGASETLPGVALSLAVAGAITRVLAVPGVNDFLEKYLPFLAATPKEAPTESIGGIEVDPETGLPKNL